MERIRDKIRVGYIAFVCLCMHQLIALEAGDRRLIRTLALTPFSSASFAATSSASSEFLSCDVEKSRVVRDRNIVNL